MSTLVGGVDVSAPKGITPIYYFVAYRRIVHLWATLETQMMWESALYSNRVWNTSIIGPPAVITFDNHALSTPLSSSLPGIISIVSRNLESLTHHRMSPRDVIRLAETIRDVFSWIRSNLWRPNVWLQFLVSWQLVLQSGENYHRVS
jgi:hypothetical protein